MIKEAFTIGINLTGFPEQLSCGVIVCGKQVTDADKLTTDQLAAAVCALDRLRFDFQTKFNERMDVLPTEGWFAQKGKA